MNSHTPLYLATVLPGLESAAADEVATKVEDAAVTETLRGKVLFTSSQPLDRLLVLRSIDNLYRWIHGFAIGPHRTHLRDVEAVLARIDLRPYVAALGFDPGKRLGFVVNASRTGKQTYSRFELAAAAARGVTNRHPQWYIGTPEEHQLEFRLDLAGEAGLLSLRLSSPTFRFRGSERQFSRAALRPSVAHGLVWLSGPKPEDRFLDPFCGSGTILAERTAYPAKQIIGGDRAPEAVAAAKGNIALRPGITIETWDARHLPLDAGSIDTVVSNLPFGRQIVGQEQIGALYLEFLQEMKRVLSPHGQAFLLTDQVEEMVAATEALGVEREQMFLLSLKGLHPWLFRLTPQR